MATVSAAPSDPRTSALAVTKRAFVYLRVSSEHQVNTDYSRDGLSINAQREAAQDKADQLDVEIVREFSDPGRSAFVDLHKRTDFLEMLEELKRCNEHPATHVDYVIVWALNRWARNQLDHWRTRELVRDAGARIVSITEPMIGDDTPESFYMEGMFALNNQYESMKTGRNVKQGMFQKAKGGGTYGRARLGYVNDVDRLPDGRHVASISPDPERSHFMTLAFQLYATGEYSLSQLADELYRLGLRTRPRGANAPGKASLTMLQRLLHDPYYLGLIVYKRGTDEETTFEGRHQALIDPETFERVQRLLEEKRTAGERPQKRQHYLKGSVFCGECGRRLTFGISTGKVGVRYPYFFCSSRVKREGCSQRVNFPPELIEEAIERYYQERPVQLTASDVAKRIAAINDLAAVSQQAVEQIRAAKTQLIEKLKAQQVRLLRLHAEEGDEFSPDAFREERLRLQTEIASAEDSLAETETRLRIETGQLKMALELAEDVAATYAKADEQTKRGFNQAFFTRLYVIPEPNARAGSATAQIDGAELTEPYAVLLADDLASGIRAEITAIRQKAKDGPNGPPQFASSSNFEHLVRLTSPSLNSLGSNMTSEAGATGLEPATSAVTGQRSNQLSYAPAMTRQRPGSKRARSVCQASPRAEEPSVAALSPGTRSLELSSPPRRKLAAQPVDVLLGYA
jgi:site-specific DNA recombinase